MPIYRLKSTKNSLSRTVKRFFSGRVKKYIFFTLLSWSASYVLVGSPFAVQASVFSFVTSFFEQGAPIADASAGTVNSQTMPLLAPALNLDPAPARGGGDIAVVDGMALQPQEGPSGIVDSTTRPGASQISIYTVREGDTLSEIAQMFGVSVNTIAWANDIQGRIIHPGQELVILPITGVEHIVVKGETLASIAKKYNADLDEVANYNELAVGAALTPGQTIIIPNGEIAAPSAPSGSTSSGSIALPPVSGSGTASAGYYRAPLAHYIRTQGIHGYNGVDLAAPAGSPVLAAADGVVILARQGGWNGGYGTYVVISHPNGTQTLYAHESSLTVSVGQHVSQGETIGYEGATGKATGPHVHFEVRGAKNPF